LIEHPGDIVVFDPDQPITDRRTEIARGSKSAYSDNAMPCATWSPNNPIDLGALPARCGCRFRLIPMKRLHHRDMRHHRITAMLADQHQHFGSGLPLRGLLFCLR
jgi:hypothetical protein